MKSWPIRYTILEHTVAHGTALTLFCEEGPPIYARPSQPDIDIALLSRPTRHLIRYVVNVVQAAYTMCI